MSRTEPTQEGIGYLLNRASRGMTMRMSAELRSLGLDHDMWMMIQGIRRSSGPGASAEEVAERLHASQSAMRDAGERLLRDGWVQAVASDRYVITARGNKALAAIDDAAHWLMEGATSGLTHEELDTLADYLKRIIDNLA